ncbi:MAG: peptide ABC transporter substrate-binding protein [Bdellovibrionaceae bacterium]|nr:peptide ABC transporter substrate-binding protein [Pseudobdellovibrionaceae bacterium]
MKAITTVFFLIVVSGTALGQTAGIFRLHLANEPANIDPHQQKSSVSSYLLQALYRNIFRYDDSKGLIPDLGESCKRDGALVLVCKLKKDLKWSDGSVLNAQDFLKSYQRILDPKNNSPRADLLFKIKNAPAIYKGQKKIESLGITAPDAFTLRFELEEKDPDFEYILSSLLLSPIKNTESPGPDAKKLITNGPYKITEWIPGQKIVLGSNSAYANGNPTKRPPVEMLFISEDSVALQLYEKNQLSFLRRLPTLYVPKFKKRADFLWLPVIRFDYFGFGPALKDHPKIREALALSLNYPEMQKIYSSEGTPGCPGVPRSWIDEDLCYKMDVKKAKAAWSEDKSKPMDLKLMYSSQGGDDHRRGTEWMQSQWKQNLGFDMQIMLRENKVYLSELQQNPPAIFRKGVAPDRPTCLAVLETFADWSPENYIQMKDPEFQSNLKALGESSSESEKKKLCTQGIKYLTDRFWIIPTGSIHFAMLAKTNFKGWKINSMNQLDLSALEFIQK